MHSEFKNFENKEIDNFMLKQFKWRNILDSEFQLYRHCTDDQMSFGSFLYYAHKILLVEFKPVK